MNLIKISMKYLGHSAQLFPVGETIISGFGGDFSTSAKLFLEGQSGLFNVQVFKG